MERADVGHTLVAAHAGRVRDLATLHASLERAVVTGGGSTSAAAKETHALLAAQLVEWDHADREAERCDVVTLATDEREALRQAVSRAIAHAQEHAAVLAPTVPAAIRSLQALQTDFPPLLTRAALTRLRRSAARLEQLELLRAPGFALGGEASLMLGAIQSATAPIERPAVEIDTSDGFHSTFAWGLDACVIREPGAVGGVDLGLGTSPAVSALVGSSGDELHALHQRWVETAAPTHPFATYPLVPRGRFGTVSATRRVRGDLDSTGPVGWAAGDDLARYVRDLRALAGRHVALAVELEAVANRVEAVAARGAAVIGLVEYLPPEADGERHWLAASP
jgi:hypothetical protein